MKRPVLVFLAVVMSLVATPAGAITNGSPDGDAHPYVGLVVFDVLIPGVGNVPRFRCSGALVSPTVVLTAGHCTAGKVGARVWFDERLQDDDGSNLVPDYPFGGAVAVEGTPHTNPGFTVRGGPGLPGFALRDVGVVVLDEPVVMDRYAELPQPGLADTLGNKAGVGLVGYGASERAHDPGEGAPVLAGLRNRMFAPSELISGRFVHADEFVRVSFNPGGGTGGFCFRDSGGPVLAAGTDTVLAVNSYLPNFECAGVGYASRVDIGSVVAWIESFTG